MAGSRTMRAWQFDHANGGIEKTMYLNESAPLPTASKPLGPNEVLVRVHYAALNQVDYKLPELPLVGGRIIPKPCTPGLEFSGEVAEKGSEVDLAIGQRVFGKVEPKVAHGTLGEYTVVGAAGVVALPEGVSLEDAAGLPVCGLVTYQCLTKNVKSGDKVFINGGSGGTGVYAIQIAKQLGAYVTTTCSGPNVELCKSLGADEVIDYKSQDAIEVLKASGTKYDMVLDNIGFPPELYWACPAFTKSEAPYIQIGTQMSLAFVRDLICRFLLPAWLGGGQRKFAFGMTATNKKDMEVLASWMKEGKIKAVNEEVFAFEDASKAYTKLKTGRAKGKLVVRVAAKE